MIVVRVSSDPLAVRNSADGIGRNVANQLFHGFCRRGIVSENSLRTGKKLGLAEPTLELLLSAEAALANMRLEQEGPQLLVSRVGTYMPHISNPDTGGGWVVSESVKAALTDCPNLQFRPVRFEKLVDYPFPEDVWNYKVSQRAYVEPRKLIAKRKDCAKFHEGLPQYYQMIPIRLVDIYPPARNPISGKSDDEELIHHCSQLPVGAFDQKPVISSVYGILFREDMYERIMPFLDKRFFAIWEMRMPSEPGNNPEGITGTE